MTFTESPIAVPTVYVRLWIISWSEPSENEYASGDIWIPSWNSTSHPKNVAAHNSKVAVRFWVVLIVATENTS